MAEPFRAGGRFFFFFVVKIWFYGYNDFMKKEKLEEQIVIEANIQYETDQILDKFREQGIGAVPLKGIILKNDYPHQSMRTMSDVDILYDTTRKSVVKRIFASMGYELVRDINDQLDFSKPPFPIAF